MPTPLIFPDTNHLYAASARVYSKVNWADTWTPQPRIHCRRLSLCAAPGISTASFHWRIGEVLWPGAGGYAASPVLAINPRSYVRVDVIDNYGAVAHQWYGVWHRAEMSGDTQSFTANGIETLLDEPCLDAACMDLNPNAPSVPLFAGRGLIFNSGGKGNRSIITATVNGQSVYSFYSQSTGQPAWSTRDAVQYLLAMAAPKKPDGTIIFNWTASGLVNLPNFDEPILQTHGRSYWSLLTSLVSRFRLTSFVVESTTVRFFTFADSAITVTDNNGSTKGTIPANVDTYTLDIRRDRSARASLATEASHVCDQVVVIGERRRSMFSLRGRGDKTLVGDWTPLEELQYQTGAGWFTSSLPPVTEPRLREELDRDMRHSERMRHVFARFTVPEEWHQLAGGGNAEWEPIALTADESARFWIYSDAIRFLPELPLLTGYDYDAGEIASHQGNADGKHRGKETDTEHPHEPIPCFAVARIQETTQSYSGNEQWVYADQIGRIADSEVRASNYTSLDDFANENARDWSISVRVLRDKPSVELRVDGEQQHAIATAEFPSTLRDCVQGAIDWRDIIVTVCAEDTRHAEIKHPADSAVTAVGERKRVLRIEAPGHELIYVVPGTVVRIEGGTRALIRSTGGYLVDQRPQMMVIAQRAYQWHKQPRYTLGLSTGLVSSALRIGYYIDAYTDARGTFPVDSVLTEATFDFPVSESDKPQRANVSYVTAFGELDPIKVI